MPDLTLSILPGTFAVCRLAPAAPLPAWATSAGLLSLTRTPDELSVVCAQTAVPPDVQQEQDFAALKVEGPLDFALTGILAALATPLAQARISIFAISTYDTDYILVRAANLPQAITVLEHSGCRVRPAPSL